MEHFSVFAGDLADRFVHSLQIEALRYGLGTLTIFLVVWVVLGPFIRSRKIRGATPPVRQMWMEIRQSVLAMCVFVAADMAIFAFGDLGVFKKYDNIAEYGWPYFWLSIPLWIVLHDAYFYWTHRMMHLKRFYRVFHMQHHRSHNPTPFTAYNFAPGEALVSYLFIPITLMVLPIHGTALYTVMTIMIFKNAIGHCGYELMPRRWVHTQVLGCLTSVTHHDMHHERATGNYGFYFTWWDRWMGTEHADYLDRVGQQWAADLDRRQRPVAAE
jgi:Delta7-sterol 5-desaturase